MYTGSNDADFTLFGKKSEQSSSSCCKEVPAPGAIPSPSHRFTVSPSHPSSPFPSARPSPLDLRPDLLLLQPPLAAPFRRLRPSPHFRFGKRDHKHLAELGDALRLVARLRSF